MDKQWSSLALASTTPATEAGQSVWVINLGLLEVPGRRLGRAYMYQIDITNALVGRFCYSIFLLLAARQ